MFNKSGLFLLSQDIKGQTIMDEVDNILQELRGLGYRDRTLKDYRYHFKNMTKGLTHMDELNRAVLINYIGDSDLKASTRSIRLKAVRALLNRMYNRGIIKENYWYDIKIRVDTPIKEGLTEEELIIILSQLDFESYAQFRDATAILLMWETGARLSTLSQVTEAMIDFEDNLIHYQGSIMKNGLSLSLPISKDLSGMLKYLIKWSDDYKAHETELVFISTQALRHGKTHDPLDYAKMTHNIIAKYRKLTGVKNLNPHAIRRGFAKRLMDKGVKVPIISKALNHSSLEATSRYLRISNDEVIESLRDM